MAQQSSPKLVCPQCAAVVPVSADAVCCAACGWAPAIVEGIIDLREDKSFDTLLDVEAYDGAHGVDAQTALLAKVYEGILRDKGCDGAASVCEIGAGSGNLTYGLLNSDFFGEVHTSDISLAFMKLLRKRVGADSHKGLFCYLLDANKNPFESNSFDLVVGHSILHHLERFETTIRESFRITKPGGFCVFGEPILDIHVFVGLSCSIILHMEGGKNRLERCQLMALKALAARPQLKRDHLESDRTGLRAIEDKFMFPIDYMRALSASIGFKGFDCVSVRKRFTLGEHVSRQIRHVLAQTKADAAFVDDYAFLFKRLTENYAKPMKMNEIAPFSFFVFSK